MPSLTKQEIIDYANRYVSPDEVIDFPFEGELFSLLGREVSTTKVLAEEEGWSFQGYGVCLGYSLDTTTKPAGKWIWMHFASLIAFPPAPQVFKLQPPHIAKGRFQDPSRTREFRILKVALRRSGGERGENGAVSPPLSGKDTKKPGAKHPGARHLHHDKIVQFRKKKT